MIKKICNFIFIITILFTVAALSSAVIVDFKGDASRNMITIKWSTVSEVNCKEFVIERSLDNRTFNRIGTVEATGSSSDKQDYKYEDKSVFKTSDNTFYYRINIVDKDGRESMFSEVVSVTASVSSVRHTWGSLKAMFR
ncbi:MAG: hypothetical protein V2J62_04985 [candidate division KSB1 bacterium]|jgi:hypothetical protein|nr:hypothetical protein [candidate division KSB1 bacterium]